MADIPVNSVHFPEELIRIIRSATHILVLTGAGISAESGIPTFREAQTGLWAKYNPEDLATPEAFQRNPRLVWEWYAWRRDLVQKAVPNPGHIALTAMEKVVPNFHLITQNVDNLHRISGSQNIIEFHGNIFQTKCSYEDIIIESWPETSDIPPRCPRCNHFLRPNVVLFGEPIPQEAITLAANLIQSCEVFFSIGTSSLVEPAASLPITARQHGSVLVEINLEPTPLTYLADFVLQGPSGIILPELIADIWPQVHPQNTNFSSSKS
jgi:NAD-dependent deacetylase